MVSLVCELPHLGSLKVGLQASLRANALNRELPQDRLASSFWSYIPSSYQKKEVSSLPFQGDKNKNLPYFEYRDKAAWVILNCRIAELQNSYDYGW